MALATHTGFSKPFFIVTWVEFGVSIGLIISRCYTATRIIHHVAGDLYLTLATFILAIGSMSMITAGAAHGLGMSQIYLTLEQQHYALLYGWLSQFLALIAIGMGKLAIVAFLEQIQGGISRYRTFTLWFLAGSNLIVNVIAAVLAMVECNPVQKLWDEDIPGDCRGRKRIQIFGYVQGSWSAICDFALVLFPILVFARVRAFSMPTKIGICALMSCGIV